MADGQRDARPKLPSSSEKYWVAQLEADDGRIPLRHRHVPLLRYRGKGRALERDRMAMAERSGPRWRATTATITLDTVAADSAAETGKVGSERHQREHQSPVSGGEGTTSVVPLTIRPGRRSLA